MTDNLRSLAGRTLFITGASRGIGLNIALRAAADGANVVIAARTTEPHPTLPGTIFTAAKEIEAAGGKALPCVVDVRNEEQVVAAFKAAADKFGGIDVLINNAYAVHMTGTEATSMKTYDLMHQINSRGTFMCSKYAIPYLRKGTNPHILNIGPPLNMSPRWFKDHVAYTTAKYGVSLCVLGMAEELKAEGIAVNALWPKTAVYTSAMEKLGGEKVKEVCRRPEIMSDAAHNILTGNGTGNFYLDEDVLRAAGMTDFEKYAYVKDAKILPDFFIEDVDFSPMQKYIEDARGRKFTPQDAPAEAAATSGPALTFQAINGALNGNSSNQ